MQGKTLVTLEGQQHWVDNEIAQDDTLLRQLFSTLSPELAGAEIKRHGSQIDLVTRKGTKGTKSTTRSTALVILDASQPELNPGVECCVALQQHELRQGIDRPHATAIAQEIDAALGRSKQWDEWIQSTLQRLDQAAPTSVVPLGF